MTPPVSHAKPAEDDQVKISFGAGFIKKLWPFLIGGSLLGGGTISKFWWNDVKTQHDTEIAVLKEGQAKLQEKQDKMDGKLDLIMDGLDIHPIHKRHR
jgi:hypothetical protein